MCGWLVIRATDSDPRIPSTKNQRNAFTLSWLSWGPRGVLCIQTHTHMRIFTYTNTENQTTIWIWYNWAGGTQPLSTCVGLFRQPVRSLVGAWIGRPAPQERRPYVTIVQSLAFYPSQKDQPNTFEYLQSPSIFIYLFHNKSLLFFFLL